MGNVYNGYALQGEWNNKNSGNSKWGFAVKNRHIYFIKELISPVYPVDDGVLSPAIINERRMHCQQFEERYRKIYEVVNSASCGNLVRIVDFFRCGSKYYLVNERAGNNAISVDQICKIPEEKKLFLMKSAAFCFACFHKAGMIHFDVKPNNIIIKETVNKKYVAKLIDFDAGFLKEEIREDMDISGDATYFAPESILYMMGEDVKLDEKLDIFSLGLVFHEYWCGKLPTYDENQFDYAYEAALELGHLDPDYNAMPEKLGKMIGSMLDVEPANRPSAQEIVDILSELLSECTGEATVKAVTPSNVTIKVEDVPEAKVTGGWFSQAGDLDL